MMPHDSIDNALTRRRNARTRNIRVLLLALFCLCLMESCHQKELLYPASMMIDVSVLFDWTDAPDAAPDGMTVIFFPTEEDGRIWRYELAGASGGTVSLPAGNYRMLAFNNDTKYISYDGISELSTYDAFTSRSTLSWPESVISTFPEIASYTAYHSPDALYCGTAENISVTLCNLSYTPVGFGDDYPAGEIKTCEKHIIRCRPQPRTCSYTCIYRNVQNAGSLSRGYMILSGLSPSELIADDVLSFAQATSVFSASRKNNEISGTTRGFGVSADSDTPQYLYLIAILTDGTVLVFRHDVSMQISQYPDKRDVVIIIDGIGLPYIKPDTPDGPTTGFDPEIEDWELVIVNKVIGWNTYSSN